MLMLTTRMYPKVSGLSHKKYMLTKINTCWEATERVMAAKLTRLTHKMAMQLHLVAESCTVCSSRSRRPVRKLWIHPRILNHLIDPYLMNWSFKRERNRYLREMNRCSGCDVWVRGMDCETRKNAINLIVAECNKGMNNIDTRLWLETHVGDMHVVRGFIQKLPDWPPCTALCHQVQFYSYFVSQFSEFCRRSPLCCFWTSNTKGKSIFRYRHSPETFGYTLI
jgi:hypothetical protein